MFKESGTKGIRCSKCINYQKCLDRGDPDAINDIDGKALHCYHDPNETDKYKSFIDYIGMTVYRICPKCNNEQVIGKCNHCAWSGCVNGPQGCDIFGLWNDNSFPPDKCYVNPMTVTWYKIPLIAKNWMIRIFPTEQSAYDYLDEVRKLNNL